MTARAPESCASGALRPPGERAALRAALLAWYDAHGRALPWRVGPSARAAGVRPDPYAIWLSEVMSQQTTIAVAAPYHAQFLKRFPRVEDLAAASLDEVLSLWAGLGYYARARNLHACAQAVASAGGTFPTTEAELVALPGVGPYTAAAVAAICFDAPTNVVDGNVERVIARLFAIEEPLPRARALLRRAAALLVAEDRPGDYAQALMDLGSQVCAPRAPRCGACPWSTWCQAFSAGMAERLPARAPRSERPLRHGAVFAWVREGRVWVRRRPAEGLLGAMVELPGADWVTAPMPLHEALAAAPVAHADWRAMGAVRHVFTHFALTLDVFRLDDPGSVPQNVRPSSHEPDAGWWADVTSLRKRALPSLMVKACVRAGLLSPPPAG